MRQNSASSNHHPIRKEKGANRITSSEGWWREPVSFVHLRPVMSLHPALPRPFGVSRRFVRVRTIVNKNNVREHAQLLVLITAICANTRRTFQNRYGRGKYLFEGFLNKGTIFTSQTVLQSNITPSVHSVCTQRCSVAETRLSSGESAAGSVCANLPIPQSENVPVGIFFLQGGG